MPIHAAAAFLGVGGSVMTVALLRRAGLPMGHAAALANPLTLVIIILATLVIIILATVVFFLVRHTSNLDSAVFAVGIVDHGTGPLLLVEAIPVSVVVRRRPPRIPDRIHAWACVGLLFIVLTAMFLPLLTAIQG
ncbi:hypothetical protein [Brevibacterium aurantiacum]|uniref:hypothetical protein n=1 Tax=Brevibacterium aurantiacum TaxID=273384 RepID=UPI0021B25EEE|nr:hypothetical protein [Brevibacterium aurantiacum]